MIWIKYENTHSKNSQKLYIRNQYCKAEFEIIKKIKEKSCFLNLAMNGDGNKRAPKILVCPQKYSLKQNCNKILIYFIITIPEIFAYYIEKVDRELRKPLQKTQAPPQRVYKIGKKDLYCLIWTYLEDEDERILLKKQL